MWVLVQYSLPLYPRAYKFSSLVFGLIHMLPYVGIEIYFGPTAKAREIWQALMTYVNFNRVCFLLTANQFCIGREDYLLPL